MRLKFEISGMTCAACAARVEKAAAEVEGVSDVQVNLLRNTMSLETGEENVSSAVIASITAAGYGARIAGQMEKKQTPTTSEHTLARLLTSVGLLLVLMYFTMGHMIGLPLPHWYHGRKTHWSRRFYSFF